jgi:hypothetical protein
VSRPEYRPPRGTDAKAIENQLREILGQFGIADASVIAGPVSVGTAETRIPHGFGSIPSGWELISPQALATVCQTKAPDATYLYLKASTAVTTSVRVF